MSISLWAMIPWCLLVLVLLWRVWRLEKRLDRVSLAAEQARAGTAMASMKDSDYRMKLRAWTEQAIASSDRHHAERMHSLARALGYEWKRTEAKEGWERKEDVEMAEKKINDLRGRGHTSEMMAKARCLAESGKDVLVIAANDQERTRLTRIGGDCDHLTVVSRNSGSHALLGRRFDHVLEDHYAPELALESGTYEGYRAFRNECKARLKAVPAPKPKKKPKRATH